MSPENSSMLRTHDTKSNLPKAASVAADKVYAARPTEQPLLAKELVYRLPIQCKLTIGATDDPLEREADAMADKIMRMPEQSFIQRKCAHCEEEEQLQRKPISSFIQRKVADEK